MSMSSPESRKSARATATSSAAEAESPAPIGRSEAIRRSAPHSLNPWRKSINATPRAKSLQSPRGCGSASSILNSKSAPKTRTRHARSIVGARGPGDIDSKIDRRRQHEAVIVIGVLADKIDPSRRAKQQRLAFMTRTESVYEIGRDIALHKRVSPFVIALSKLKFI